MYGWGQSGYPADSLPHGLHKDPALRRGVEGLFLNQSMGIAQTFLELTVAVASMGLACMDSAPNS